MKHYRALILVLSFTLCFSGCGKKTAEEAGSVFRILDADYELNLPASTVIHNVEDEVIVEISDGAVETVDLTPLGDVPEMEYLTVSSSVPLESLILPSRAVNVSVTVESLGFLDASRAGDMTQLTLNGAVGRAAMPEHLDSVVSDGVSLGLFADLPSLTHVMLTRQAELSPLKDFTALEVLYLSRPASDEPWEFSPLKDVKFTTLRLDFVTQGELAGLAGSSFRVWQVSDEYVSDLSVLDALPNTDTLLLNISSIQPVTIPSSASPCDAEALAVLNTPIPAEQLIAFTEHGEVYLYTNSRR